MGREYLYTDLDMVNLRGLLHIYVKIGTDIYVVD